MGYVVRLNDKKNFWSEFANNFIPEFQKFPLKVFDSVEEVKDFAIENSKNRKRPLLVCEAKTHKIDWDVSKVVEDKVIEIKVKSV